MVTGCGLVPAVSVQSNVSCNGLSNGTATINPGGGTSPYTYSWGGPSSITGTTTATLTGLSAGTYTVTVSDAASCTSTVGVTITQPTALTATAAVDNQVSCNGLSDGQATVNPSGGPSSSYTYLCTGGATNSTISGLAAGAYAVTVSSGSCSSSATVSITEPAVLSVSFSPSNISCYGLSDGEANAIPSGGPSSAYTYAWNTGSTHSGIMDLGPGVHSVSVTSNSCAAYASVTITQPNLLSASASVVNNASCTGASNGVATVLPSGGISSYTYLWSNGATTQDASGLVVGTYSVTVTSGSCFVVASTSITAPPSPVKVYYRPSIYGPYNVSSNGASDGFIRTYVLGGTPPYTYD